VQALKLVDTRKIDKAAWLDYRRQGLGGSDVSAICNMNRYRSPMVVYLDKIGELPAIDENESMYWGNRLEEVVAEEFTRRTGIKVRKRNAILVHPQHNFMFGNIDREIVGEKAGLEIKTANEYAKEDWNGEGVPKEYALQCHHYMAVTGYERWYVAVLIGGNKFEWRVIERDEDIIRSLIEIESDFWNNHVIKRIPPAFSAHDTMLLNERYPTATEHERVDLTQYRDDVEGFLQAQNQLNHWKFVHEDFKNKIKGHMQNGSLAFYNEQLLFTWKNTARGSRVFKTIGGKHNE
jgi:putative phage-type endonuclease